MVAAEFQPRESAVMILVKAAEDEADRLMELAQTTEDRYGARVIEEKAAHWRRIATEVRRSQNDD